MLLLSHPTTVSCSHELIIITSLNASKEVLGLIALLSLVHLLVDKLDIILKTLLDHLERLDAGSLIVASFVKLALSFLKQLVQGVQNTNTLVLKHCRVRSTRILVIRVGLRQCSQFLAICN